LGLPPDFNLGGENLLDVSRRYKELESEAPGEAARVRSLQDIELVFKQIDIFRPPPPNPAILEFSRLIWAEVGPDNYYLGLSSDESIHITRDALGSYNCLLKSKARSLTKGADIRETFSYADKWVQEQRADSYRLLDSSQPWRADGPTDKQIKWLTKFGVPITNGMTKGEASQILDKLFKDNPKPKRPKWLEQRIQSQKKSNW
jgi:hypothetical protein